MSNGDLAARIRDYARGKGRAATATSSAWLAREFQVDPRTIAAALRPYGVKPAPIEPGVRGYLTVDLAGLNLPCEPGHAQAAAAAAPGGGGAPTVAAGAPSEVGPGPAQDHERPPASALTLLSAGAGHDMTPALRAAGLL